MKLFPFERAGLVAVLSLVVGACSSGGGGGSSAPPSPPPVPAVTLTGTAATGAAIANAAILVKDRNGQQASGTTGATGAFNVDVTGLTEPFLLRVTPSSGRVLYSVGMQSGVVNITPITDTVIRNYYRARGFDVATVFDNLSSTSLVPTAAEISVVVAAVKNLFAQWLTANGIDPDGFDPLTVSFAANGTGFDAVLDMSSITDNGTQTSVTVTSGAVTQTTSLAANSATNDLTTSSTTTAGAATTQSAGQTIVPSGNALAALTGVNQTLSQLRATINARGAALAASDVTSLITNDFLGEGETRGDFAATVAAFGRLNTVESASVSRVHAYDDVNKIIDVDILFVASNTGGRDEEIMRTSFREQAGSWLMYGNRQLGDVEMQVEMRTDNNNGTPVSGPVGNADVRVPQGVIDTSSVSIGCPGFFGSTPMPQNGTEIVTYQPTTNSADDYPVTRDVFFATTPLSPNSPPPGTVCNVSVTPLATGTPVIYPLRTRATTTESITATTVPAGNSVASVVGQNVTINWTLPVTFGVVWIDTGANVSNTGTGASIMVDPQSPVGSSSTSATFAIPSTVGGNPVNRVSIGVAIEGPNGERIHYIHHFQ